MATLVVNLPSIDVWVRKEYLRDGEDGHGEFVKGVWVTAKSMLLLLNHRPQLQIWIFIISSFGIAWIMGWWLLANNL
jgi:hypothetical protein